MRYVVGLGNPGRKYRDTRHNIGFWVVDRIASTRQIQWSSGRGEYLYGRDQQMDLTVVKPLTYMNNSGQAVRQLIEWEKGSYEDLLVVYDDLDLPLGRIRFRPEGGPGTHKGIRSVIGVTGTEHIPRLRLGIGIPDQQQPSEKFVLQSFTSEEQPVAVQMVDKAVEGIMTFITEGMEYTMNEYNKVEIDSD